MIIASVQYSASAVSKPVTAYFYGFPICVSSRLGRLAGAQTDPASLPDCASALVHTDPLHFVRNPSDLSCALYKTVECCCQRLLHYLVPARKHTGPRINGRARSHRTPVSRVGDALLRRNDSTRSTSQLGDLGKTQKHTFPLGNPSRQDPGALPQLQKREHVVTSI